MRASFGHHLGPPPLTASDSSHCCVHLQDGPYGMLLTGLLQKDPAKRWGVKECAIHLGLPDSAFDEAADQAGPTHAAFVKQLQVACLPLIIPAPPLASSPWSARSAWASLDLAHIAGTHWCRACSRRSVWCEPEQSLLLCLGAE
jgi:hypothetical protein